MFGWNGKYENLMKYKEWKMRKYENICREGIPWRGGLLVGRWWVEPLGHWVNNRPSWGGYTPLSTLHLSTVKKLWRPPFWTFDIGRICQLSPCRSVGCFFIKYIWAQPYCNYVLPLTYFGFGLLFANEPSATYYETNMLIWMRSVWLGLAIPATQCLRGKGNWRPTYCFIDLVA